MFKGKVTDSKFNFIMLVIISFFRFWGDSYFYGYLARYLNTLGIDNVKLGILLSLIPFMAVIGNLFISKVGTSFKRSKIIIGVWTIIETAFIIASGFYTAFWFVVLFDIMCNLCSNSFYNIYDTFILPISKKAGKTYAFGRMFGTLAYIGGTFTGGLLIEAISYKYTFLIAGLMMLIGGILFYFLRFKDFEDDQKEKEENLNEPKYREVFENKTFLVYMIATSLFIGAHWAGDNCFALYTGYLNVSSSDYGYSFGIAVVMEAVFLFLMSKVKKPASWKLLLISAAVASIVKDTLLAIPNLNTFVYLAAESLRGVTYGMILAANLNLMEHILGKRLLRKGFFITIVFDELLAATLDFFMPSIIEKTSYTVMFTILICIISASLVMYLSLRINPVSYDERTLKTSN